MACRRMLTLIFSAPHMRTCHCLPLERNLDSIHVTYPSVLIIFHKNLFAKSHKIIQKQMYEYPHLWCKIRWSQIILKIHGGLQTYEANDQSRSAETILNNINLARLIAALFLVTITGYVTNRINFYVNLYSVDQKT